MSAKRARQPTYATNEDGQQVVLVRLANFDVAVRVLTSDFEALLAANISTQWTLNRNSVDGIGYVRAPSSEVTRQLVTVARLIMRAGPGEVVRYHSGDRTDLRRANLYLGGGKAKGRERDLMRGAPWVGWGTEEVSATARA
jgi:hypothetical protein